MIPKLQPDRSLDDSLDLVKTFNALDDQLSFTLNKVRGAQSCTNLSSRLDAPRVRVEQLRQRALSSLVSEDEVLGLVDAINQLRCELLGELTAIGCAQGRAANWPSTFFRPVSSVKTDVLEPPRLSRGPASAEDWLDVARDRARDAQAMLEGKRRLGSVYMAGYAIECSLKALLYKERKLFPSSGRDGHNLHALWKASGFQLRDLQDPHGAKRYFVEKWSTDLRYDLALLDTDLPESELVRGARELVGQISNRMRRARGTR